LCFLTLVDLTDELYAWAIDERQYIVAEVVFIDLVDLGGDFQRDASSARNPDRAVRALLHVQEASTQSANVFVQLA
jgi:hypothetical protein